MGIYLNPNNDNFARTLKRPIYVDKTQMISVINNFIETEFTIWWNNQTIDFLRSYR